MKDKRYIIYKATSPSGRYYIGQTCKGLDSRKLGHYKQSKNKELKQGI